MKSRNKSKFQDYLVTFLDLMNVIDILLFFKKDGDFDS